MGRATVDETGIVEEVSLEELRRRLPDGFWRRSLCDYRGRYLSKLSLRLPGAESVVVAQAADVSGWDGGDPMTTGGTVWDSALLLASHLCYGAQLRGLRALELGAGTGLLGLVARRLGAEVALTDLPPMLPLLERNARLNFPGDAAVSVRPFPWQEASADAVWLQEAGGFDLVLLSDVLYHEEQCDPLVLALQAVAEARRAAGAVDDGSACRSPLRGFWAQELHQPELFQRAKVALEFLGWQVSIEQSFEDGIGPEIVVCELTACLGES